MEQKTEIKNLQQLIDWIDNSENCVVSEQEDDYFYIEAPNNADVFINLEEDDVIDDIISRTIERLEEFDADDEFTELWSKEFAKHNGFTPLQFITMLQKDEASFRELAGKLKKLMN